MRRFEMKNAIALAAVAGIATAAAAQSGSLSIVASQATVDSTLTTSFTLSVYGDADFATHITGAAFNLNASGGDMVTDMVASGAAWGGLGFEDQGHTGGGNTGMIMGQITFLPFIAPDPASALGNGPVFLGSFAVTIAADSSGTIDWSLAGGIGTFALEVIDVNANPGGNPPGLITQLASPDFGSVSVNVVPAPSAMAVLGLGGLVAGRRRR
tara:strand:+ start:122123 stop:122758 length:636 start_codon:yes stop_codon:yes gene_type:complete